MSGGIDSTAMAHYYLNHGYTLLGIFVDYGQLSNKFELEAVHKIGEYYNFPIRKLKVETLKNFGSGEIHGRNLFLLSVALLNYPRDFGVVAIGIHDGTNYTDCSKSFRNSMQGIFNIYNDGLIQIGTPFIGMSKQEVWGFCLEQKVPLNLTYSCEKGVKGGCGKCLSCKDKIKLNEISSKLKTKA